MNDYVPEILGGQPMKHAMSRLGIPFAALVSTFGAASFPAQAQLTFDPKIIGASPASAYARYYAPYAIQAAAAYTDVAVFNQLTRRAIGADVDLATQGFAGNETVLQRAKEYLRSWRYQFGNTGYLTCYESDAECQQAVVKDRWTKAISDGPTFHVWARTRTAASASACNEVSIVFRGSTTSLADWISNFNPLFGSVVDDEYRQLRRNIDAIIKKIRSLPCVRQAGQTPQIVSVGHSLGAGLAQFAALANNPSRPKIAKVFAFDPSPVTAAGYVDRKVLKINIDDVEIDRIYQTGEVLQPVRSVVQQLPSGSAPCVRTVAFDVIPPVGLVGRHNMTQLAGFLVALSYYPNQQQAFLPTPKIESCKARRYSPPVTDGDVPPIAPATPTERMVNALPPVPTRLARSVPGSPFAVDPSGFFALGAGEPVANVGALFKRRQRLSAIPPLQSSLQAWDVAAGLGSSAF